MTDLLIGLHRAMSKATCLMNPHRSNRLLAISAA